VTAEHLRRAEHQLHLDPVTGLASRGEVDDRLDAAVASWTAEQVPVALLMVDVVGLRDLVATDGRQAADQVVRRCAALVSATAGHVPGAFAGRYDWDRFCVVVPGRPADESVALAEALVRQARRTLPLPVSCGVVATDDIPGPVPTRDRLVRLVEAAQSRARQAGGLVPVVAGRHLPEQALPAGAPGAPLPGPEGGEPGRSASLGVLVRLGVDAVDRAGPRVVDRLVAVASLLCHHVDGLGWWVSTVVDGRRVVTVEFARLRLTPTMTTGPGEPEWTDDGYLLADYPATQSAVAGGWFVVEASDPGADPAELALLDGMGAASLLAAGGADDDGRRWLVEVVGDSLSRPMEDVATALRALLPSALRPLGPRPGDGLPAPDPAVVTTR